MHDFGVEDVPIGGEEITVPPPVGSKVLFLESAKLPNRDRLQINLGRSLHYFRLADAYHILGHHPADRPEYKQVPDEKILADTARQLSRFLAVQHSEDRVIEELRKMVAILRSRPSGRAPAVVLESFDGFVDQVEGDTAYVRLKSREHGDILYGEYPASELLEKGIEEQTRFLCRTAKVDGTTRVDIQAVPNVQVTGEELRVIEEKIDRALPRDDSGIEY
jgi:hypothetical protein